MMAHTCPVCQSVFRTLAELINHMKNGHTA